MTSLVEAGAKRRSEEVPRRHLMTTPGRVPVRPRHVGPGIRAQDSSQVDEDPTSVRSVLKEVGADDAVKARGRKRKLGGIGEHWRPWARPEGRELSVVSIDGHHDCTDCLERLRIPSGAAPEVEQATSRQGPMPLIEVDDQVRRQTAIEGTRVSLLAPEEPPEVHHAAQRPARTRDRTGWHRRASYCRREPAVNSLGVDDDGTHSTYAPPGARSHGPSRRHMHPPSPSSLSAKIGDLAADAGIRSINVLAWRDLDDPEAGGSEAHIDEVMRGWGRAGIAVTMRTSFVPGQPTTASRGGYRVIRRAGRYLVFPRAMASEALRRHGPADAVVEVWNGMPFLTPAWAPTRPRLALLHHLHTNLWPAILDPRAARAGDLIERRLAPLMYRRTPVVTLSPSSRDDLLARTWLRPSQVHVVPPGIGRRFLPAPASRESTPLVVTVGRLVPSKRVDLLVDAIAEIRRRGEPVRLLIVGEGYERDALRAQIDELGLGDSVELCGRLSSEALVAVYQRSWLILSASVAEGWGMSLSEAAACGTPAVATRIPGHLDAVEHGVGGLLVPPEGLADAIHGLLTDPNRLEEMGAAARRRAAQLSWDRSAYDLLRILAGRVEAD